MSLQVIRFTTPSTGMADEIDADIRALIATVHADDCPMPNRDEPLAHGTSVSLAEEH